MDSLGRKLKDFFKEIRFEAKSHVYTLGNKKLPSVSGLIKDFVDDPDFDMLAGFKAKKIGVEKKELLKQWKDITDTALVQGNKTHHFAETIEVSIPTKLIEEAVFNFWKEVPAYYNRIVRELRMVHFKYLFCGTCDFVLFNERTNSFIIGDYKTNKDIFKNFREKKLKYPFYHLLDSPINKYQIQLSFYKILLEQFGIPVSEMWIIWVMPDGSHKRFITHDYSKELLEYLNNKQ